MLHLVYMEVSIHLVENKFVQRMNWVVTQLTLIKIYILDNFFGVHFFNSLFLRSSNNIHGFTMAVDIQENV